MITFHPQYNYVAYKITGRGLEHLYLTIRNNSHTCEEVMCKHLDGLSQVHKYHSGKNTILFIYISEITKGKKEIYVQAVY